MEFQEAGSSSTARVKVDVVQPIKDKKSIWNHRKSLAWDTAFFTNPGVLDPEELFGSLKIDENEIEVEVNHKHSIKTLLSETDARPSFAWDNAFFTDPGVLDAEELSLVNNGFTSNTQLRKSADSMATITQGSRFSVASIEFDLFHDLRASLRNSPNVKQTVTREIHPKLPDGIKRTKGYKQKDQPLSLIPQPKVSSSSSFSLSSISKPLTPSQIIREKKCVASELGKNKGKHKNHGFEEQSGSKSNIRSSYSSYAFKDLTSSSSGLRLPLPKMSFFDSQENGEKENREPNAVEANRRRKHKTKLETSSSTPENRSILGQRKMRK
ncbi:hypothetical protein ISN45_Aa04g023850 [Arabidopsis thaliana x Arabidopsis arenosa]|uniref:Uncharacterized protein n=1 Tax=Arabidopsis thaliana x Arabidopsis arenosa TaxID=1240361 RepID=A0A8T2A7Y6_9BRAS|nr:hypothetical protein ISN45_Aa04g023850 [Arabidopsis thaliana x Arabidopsis arenosa]